VKKILTIAGCALLFLGLFAGSLILAINLRGGLGESHAKLAQLPLLGALIKVQQGEAPTDQETTQPEGAEKVPEAPSLPPLTKTAALERFARELEEEKSNYEAMVNKATRQQRELDAWQKQLEKEGRQLLERLKGERGALEQLKREVEQEKAALNALQVEITGRESANLKKAAEIYGKMAPQDAAEVLEEICAQGKQDMVVKIIYFMPGRNAAKTLASIKDPKVSAEITEKLSHIRNNRPGKD